MSKQESRVAVQVVGVPGGESVEGLYVLASDGSIWKLSEFKDLAYWQQLDPLSNDPPNPGEVTTPTRHALLCDTLQKLELGADLSELTTKEIVEVCRGVIADASADEILAALRTLGRKV